MKGQNIAMAFLLNDTQDVVAQPLGVSLLKTILGRGFYPQIFVTDNNLCCVGHLDAEMLKQDLAASQKCEARAKVCCTQMGHECPPF